MDWLISFMRYNFFAEYKISDQNEVVDLYFSVFVDICEDIYF